VRNQTTGILWLWVLLAAPAFPQGVEIFGGAQFEHLQSAYNAVGWNASLTGNFKHILGITGDFSGAYKSRTVNSNTVNSSVYTYTVGPVLTARLPVVQPFVHALFGGATLSIGGARSTAFAILAGAGLDIGLRKGIGIRLVQADWLMTQFNGNTQNHQGRVSAGLVVKF
jgi:hypothetical protein